MEVTNTFKSILKSIINYSMFKSILKSIINYGTNNEGGEKITKKNSSMRESYNDDKGISKKERRK